MNFLEAMKLCIIYDKKVTRTDHVHTIWNNIKYIFYNGDLLSVCNNNNERRPYHISASDISNDDWEIYEEKPKTYTFQEALRAFNEGKNIKNPDRTYWVNRRHDYEYEEIFTLRDVNATDWIIE